MEPGPNDRDSILPYLIENYGWPISKPQYPKDEKSLRVDMDAKSYAERGFIINVNSQLKRFEKQNLFNNLLFLKRFLNPLKKCKRFLKTS